MSELLQRLMALLCFLAAGWGVSHARHDVTPEFGAADGPPSTRRGGSNAGPVEAALGRSASILTEVERAQKYLTQVGLDMKLCNIVLEMFSVRLDKADIKRKIAKKTNYASSISSIQHPKLDIEKHEKQIWLKLVSFYF